MENRREMNAVCYSKEDLEILDTETVLRFHSEHTCGPGLKLSSIDSSSCCKGGDLRRGRLRGLHGGWPTVISVVGQLGGCRKGRICKLFNVRMWGRRLGRLFLPKGLFEWASQLQEGQKLPSLSICTGGISLWAVSLQAPS